MLLIGPRINATNSMTGVLVQCNRDSLAHRVFGASEILEQFTCSYELNPAFESRLVDAGLVISGRGEAGEARVVELKYFGGLSVADVATALEVSSSTVKHDWDIARTWLLHELRKGEERAD